LFFRPHAQGRREDYRGTKILESQLVDGPVAIGKRTSLGLGLLAFSLSPPRAGVVLHFLKLPLRLDGIVLLITTAVASLGGGLCIMSTGTDIMQGTSAFFFGGICRPLCYARATPVVCLVLDSDRENGGQCATVLSTRDRWALPSLRWAV